jgi:uncharacterized protein (TIGR04141 family)
MRVTAYLLRERAQVAPDILRRPGDFQEVQLQAAGDPGVQWRLFVHSSEEREPLWLAHLRPLLAQSDLQEEIRTRSSGAVLLVGTAGRVFAVTFGTGFHALDATLIEPDFGLKVAANSIDPLKISLAEARGLGKGRRNAISKVPIPSEMFALGLLTDEEWIRRFGGDVNVPGFAKTVTGADSLQLNIAEFSLRDLPEKLDQALHVYALDRYKNYFPFLDYFRRESDKDTISELDALITQAMASRDPEIGFALPDDNTASPDVYSLSRYRREYELSELITGDVYDAIDHLDAWQNPLQHVKVDTYHYDGQLIDHKTPLRSYVIGSVRRKVGNVSHDYAITSGSWFKIDQDYVEYVDRYLQDNIPDVTDALKMPTWDEDYLKQNAPGNYGEERYNNWLGLQRGYVVLDRDLYRGRPGMRVEVCDLLTADRQLICVKRMDGSDKMSHLFQQGSVSAQMMLLHDDYQAKLVEKLRTLDSSAEFGAPSDWTIVYAIATSRPGSLKNIMYFFSRAALKMHGESIKGRGVKVALAKINRTA